MAMAAMKLFITLLFLLCLVSSLTSATSTDFDYCNKKANYDVKVSQIDITPYPIKGGRTTTFSITAETGRNLTGGKLEIDVKYFFLNVHHEDIDLCKETSCPASGDFVISHSQELPGFTPPGSYTLTMKMVDEKNKQLSCITFSFSISLFDESEALSASI
ncbi:putative phosphatidylglycerol/phosphatidylinositol transfer protein DDB_G0282179 [Solanum pennellii]|uniref:Phosphatidylglycerol/phosphatidylinositol transfer protein DDB_G0282179 n=1 Tax=Solanum pennellii TaxID=28526 RepID=A0ABM1FWE7_SOLPN|nr:putative phosphatidylglycerol/phosphatidylinositol transfer protein DDB_G0282179 [Solanum pennellii]